MTASVIRHVAPPTAAMVAVDRIRFHPRNIRAELGDLRELTASISAEGVLQPLLLHRKGSLLEVVDGHRRLAASRLAGLRRVPAVVVDELDDDEAITKMLATTLKAGVSRQERRAAVRVLVHEFGHTRSGLAERFGVHYSTIQQWLAEDTPEQVGSDREAGRKRALRRVPGARIERLADEWADRAARGLSADEAQELVSALRALIPNAPKD